MPDIELNDFKGCSETHTKRAAMSISMFRERPHAAVPSAANITAVWLAPRRPMTLQSLPYSGVNVHVARRYLDDYLMRMIKRPWHLTYAVPSQLA